MAKKQRSIKVWGDSLNEYDFMLISQIFFNTSGVFVFIAILLLVLFKSYTFFNMLFLMIVFFVLFFSGIYFNYKKVKLENDMIRDLNNAIKDINEDKNDVVSEKIQEL